MPTCLSFHNTRKVIAMGIWGDVSIPVLGICGEFSSGKTLFGLSIDPENTLMIDMEDSAATYGTVPIKKRVSFFDEMVAKSDGKKLPTNEDKFVWFRDLLLNLPVKEYSVIFVDPITDVEDGLVEYVENHPQEFNLTAKQVSDAAGLKWGKVNDHWGLLLGFAARKVETFAFTAHMGSVWKGGRPVEGKRKTKGKAALKKLTSLYIELRREVNTQTGRPNSIPIGLVFGDNTKERMSIYIPEKKIFVPILPPRIEECTPDKIREYIKNPVGMRDLHEDERLKPEPAMTDEEKLLIQAEIAENQRAAEEAKASSLATLAENAKRNAELMRKKQEPEEKEQEPEPKKQELQPKKQEQPKPDPVREELKAVEEEIKPRAANLIDQCKLICTEVGFGPGDIKTFLSKRNVTKWEQLTEGQLDEILAKLKKFKEENSPAKK